MRFWKWFARVVIDVKQFECGCEVDVKQWFFGRSNSKCGSLVDDEVGCCRF